MNRIQSRAGFLYILAATTSVLPCVAIAQTVMPSSAPASDAAADPAQVTPPVTTPSTTRSGGTALDEIVVTAQRRFENQQTVPLAISTVGGLTLEKQGIVNTQQLANSVPAVNISTNVGSTNVFIRGVGTTALTTENDVGVYVDGVYIASQTASLLNLSNIDHVEVLKGPQGTLFGRNAIGGALQIVTRTPSHETSADFSFDYANYQTVTGNAYLTTGLTDTLAVDFAAYGSKQSDGWGRALTRNADTFKQHEIQLRNKWLWTPTDRTKITLALDFSKSRNELGANWHFLPGAIGIDGKSTYAGFYNSLRDGQDSNNNKAWGVALRIEQDLDWAHFVSISAYRQSRHFSYIDQDATPIPVVEGGPTPQNNNTVTQEVQLLSPEGSKIKWIVGGYFLHDDYFTDPGFGIQVGTTLKELLLTSNGTRSLAGYAQATVTLLPETRLTGGLRYTNDHKSTEGQTFVNDVLVASGSQDKTFHKVTYRASLDHSFSDTILGYVSYDTGFKSGQYNQIGYLDPPVNPETLRAIQGGIKSELFNRRLRINVSAFHYDYSNIQITDVVTGGTRLVNAASAKIYGADIDINARVAGDLNLQGSLSLLHGRYKKFDGAPFYIPMVNAAGQPTGGNTLVPSDGAGKTSVRTPPISAYVAGDYTHYYRFGNVELNTNVAYNSGFYWDPDNRLKQPKYALLGAFVRWAPVGSSFYVRLWGNNLTGKKYYSYENAFSLGDIGSPAAPRTYGATIGAHF